VLTLPSQKSHLYTRDPVAFVFDEKFNFDQRFDTSGSACNVSVIVLFALFAKGIVLGVIRISRISVSTVAPVVGSLVRSVIVQFHSPSLDPASSFPVPVIIFPVFLSTACQV
jgi:hypothetical protein